MLTDKPKLQVLIESFRDWGRDCWCDPGKDNTCGKRFDWQLGKLPCGYDHKYTYSHIGYNLKATDMQAALGLSQIEKLPQFIERRKENFRYLSLRSSRWKSFCCCPRRRRAPIPRGSDFRSEFAKTRPLRAKSLSRALRPRRSPRDSCSAATCCGSPPTKAASIASLAICRIPIS